MDRFINALAGCFDAANKNLRLIIVLYHVILVSMIIEQTLTVPADHRISLELPRSVPIGAKARVSIDISTDPDSQNSADAPPVDSVAPVKSFRGILKGKGISIERLREMQREGG
jgi:hypothetical protein